MLTSDRVSGCLLGLCLADGLGAIFEGTRREDLRAEYENPQRVLEFLGTRSLHYTDDGEMALALAKYLSRTDTVEPDSLMKCFVDEYQAWRGYGRGTQVLIDAFRYDTDWNHLAQTVFPGGSYGNGAAMRSAPVGLRFFADHDAIWQQASLAAFPTHRNALGIEGAQLIALATSLAVELSDVDPERMSAVLLPNCDTITFGKQIAKLANVKTVADLEQFGNGIEAHESVVTSIATFALFPNDYLQAVGTAIWQGGDTDTIAAMAGALVGARVGRKGLPDELLRNLEDGDGFVSYVNEVANGLLSD